uniref:Uncharacterized protein n=1 Tax=Alexandrium catenella TaxID=2925 RepID=A0A7S1WGN7_ALECA|mmetsp:Transcript_59368/g.158966  ORF Transcript_59368/g.158966 Transcript_59368/m.158966 type:complete len:549 (+) Transcript_59368:3-1649(+)
MAPPTAAIPTLPLRADVLLSNALFEELGNGLSADVLRQCTGQEDLEQVDFVELQVDAVGSSQRVECLGELLPNLQQLRLNQSSICTIRDLGTSLTRLRVLWLCRASVQDLGGVNALPVLEELYVSFNDIRELSPLCTHEALQVLDLEGNLVEDLEEVKALQAVASLRELNLSLNPLRREGGAVREAVLAALPQVEVLDDVPRGDAVATADGASGADGLWDGGAAGVPDDGALDLSVEELLTEGAQWPDSPVAEDWQALRRLRERAATGGESRPVSSAVGRRQYAGDQVEAAGHPPATAGDTCGSGTASSSAVAALQAGRARLREQASARGTKHSTEAPSTMEEPSEQDLVVERLKRAARPAPCTWRLQATSARAADVGRRPPTGFFPDRRPITAWSSGRPTTASSQTAGATSSRSLALSGRIAESEAASDLTAGDDGAALAGNPINAARRRRRVAAAQGEEMSIWNLLHRTEAEATCLESAPLKAPPESRLATPDVRIGPPRLLTAGSGRTGAAATPARRSTAGSSIDAGPIPAPSVATGSTEVLYLE